MARWRGTGARRALSTSTTIASTAISQYDQRQLNAVARNPATTNVTALATAGMPASTPSDVSCCRPW
jgi:hypothetical protein